MNEKIHKKQNQKGITILALVITIIVLLILAGVAIWGSFGNSGVLSRASEATTKYTAAAEEESKMDDEFLGIPGEITAIMPNGETFQLTPDTIQQYIPNTELQEKVGQTVNFSNNQNTSTNTSGDNSEPQEQPQPVKQQLTIGTKLITVSSTYRLYYIDYDNKYGDGAGTVYLKADQYEAKANDQKKIADIINQGNRDTSLIEKFNPSLYKEGVTTPDENNIGMKKAICLLDPAIWNDLIQDETLKNSINYVIGAPSVELFMDSYNAYYGLTGDEPQYGSRTDKSERTKLFYQYPRNTNYFGYFVAPGSGSSATARYKDHTENYTVAADLNIGSLYYPTNSSTSYYLASPSGKEDKDKKGQYAMRVLGNNGGFVSYDGETAGFCPIISLKTNYQLNFNETNTGE